MGGGLMQLVAYGAQDIYLTGNPQITFFKVVYRRHTNFSMESIQQTWNGQAQSSGRCTATISRNGDLISKMYIEIDQGTTVTKSNPGASWITTAELEIGGQLIDRQSGLFMEVFAELTQPNPSGAVTNASGTLTNHVFGTLFQKMSLMGGVSVTAASAMSGKLFVPLQFWFCRNPGLALPLIALQYHEVKVVLQHTLTGTWGSNVSQQLYVDYIYLDTDERRRFAQVSHEYLIEQVQDQTVSDTATELNFNHPVKELMWCRADKLDDGGSTQGAVTAAGSGIKLRLNGHDRFSERAVEYFTRQQVHDYHTGPGGLTSGSITTPNVDIAPSGKFNDSIAVYSFALKPEEHQPSGTCNFSRIDNAQLQGLNGAGYQIFAINYNVLRIMSGMGGLAYSN
jgi:hypothetical protein